MMRIKHLLLYSLTLFSLGCVAVAQPHSIPSLDFSEQPIQPTEAPRRLIINVSVSDPANLKVTEGDRISVGQLIADRSRERQRLEAQTQQLTLTLQRLEHSSITPPLPPATPPPLASPTYLEQTAAIAKAKADVDQAEASIEAKHQELAYLSELQNLDPLVFEHEQANLAELQLQHTAAVREYQLTLGQRSTAEYEHSRAMAIDASSRNRDLLGYQAQWAQYEQRLRDRDYQLSQTQLKLDEVNSAIANLAVVRSPYAGKIRRIKWLGQDSSGLLSAEISLVVRASSAGAAVPGQFDGVSGNADAASDRPIIRD